MAADPNTDIRIPAHLLPGDGRFGSGPTKVPPAGIDAIVRAGRSPMGTSHRQAPVQDLVARIRGGMAELFGLPEGYEVVLGNGGAAAFWDVAVSCLIERRSQHAVFGRFSARFAALAGAAPHLEPPSVLEAPEGSRCDPVATAGVDLYAIIHNETSTGVKADVRRPEGAGDALVAVDATSAAAGLAVDPTGFDAYYFSLQKGFASDGGLWVALLSPAAVARAESVAASGRWVPASLDLGTAIATSRRQQTTNTPAVATLVMAAAQLDWMLAGGGLAFTTARCQRSARALYQWAESAPYVEPFVAQPDERSTVVGTLELDPAVPAGRVSAVLRANGIVDLDAYRGVGRNQLRVGMFPAVEPADVEALTACIDYVVAALG